MWSRRYLASYARDLVSNSDNIRRGKRKKLRTKQYHAEPPALWTQFYVCVCVCVAGVNTVASCLNTSCARIHCFSKLQEISIFFRFRSVCKSSLHKCEPNISFVFDSTCNRIQNLCILRIIIIQWKTYSHIFTLVEKISYLFFRR